MRRAISQGLKFIADNQDSNGGFTSFSSARKIPFKETYTYHTTFVPSLILAALSPQTSPEAVAIKRRLAKFLLKQKSENWAYNYWQKQSAESLSQAYPDDLDDTFCALSALVLHDPKLARESLLAGAVKILIATESQPGGPYRTWLVPGDSEKVWLDIDIAVNANISYFLTLVSEPLPNLVAMIDKALQQDKVTSPYYPSAVPLLYFIARGYRGKQRALLVKKIRQLLSTAASALDQALLVSALIKLGESTSLEVVIGKILHTQTADGSWPAAAFCIDPARGGKTFYHGSAVLTTAFAAEALWLYETSQKAAGPRATQQPARHAKSILALTAQTNQKLGKDIKNDLQLFLKRVMSGSSGQEIIGLPALFNNSLIKPLVSEDGFLDWLAAANLYGWTAYTIYDDFLDDEGDPKLLSIANVALRRSLAIFESTNLGSAFKILVTETFDTIDNANAWELKHCRFPTGPESIQIQAIPSFGNLQKLAERSVGHLLGPMAVLQKTGLAVDSAKAQKMYKALRHYLIARQLNDDAHDWEEDVRRGSITYVVANILQDAGIRMGKQNLASLVPKMRNQFWHGTMVEICKAMQKQVRLSRRLLADSQVIKADSQLGRLLDGLEASIQETLQTQAQAESFLKHYKN